MRAVAVVGVLVVLVVGCGGDASGGSDVEIVPQADFETETFTFTASGDAVDEGLMCDSGTWLWLGNETVDGEAMPNSMIEELVQAGDDFEMVVVSELDCEDGSGSIVVAERSTVDASNPGYAGEPGSTVGTWVVRSGSIGGATIGGSGDIISGGDIQVSGEQSRLTGSLTTD
jgi:hypothetical protein